MADSPVLYVYYRPDNDDAYPGVPARHITEADWARFSPSQRRIVQEATTQEGYTRRKVWVHRDLVDETEQQRAEREAAEQAAREAYERGQSIVRWRDFEPLVPGPGEVIVGGADGPVARQMAQPGAEMQIRNLDALRATTQWQPNTWTSYDGSGVIVHPSIRYFPTPFAGYHWWATASPYKDADVLLENPCVYVSKDGQDWVDAPGVQNPLIEAQPGGYNSDPYLTQDHTGRLLLYYREMAAPSKDRIRLFTSTDGRNWEGPTTVYESDMASARLVSPSVWWEGREQKWVMVGIDMVAANNYRMMRVTADSPEGPFGNLTHPTLSPAWASGWRSWHLDVLPLGSQLVGMLLAYDQNPPIKTYNFLVQSNDGGQSWTRLAKPLDGGGNTYKGCLVPLVTDQGLGLHAWQGVGAPNYGTMYARLLPPAQPTSVAALERAASFMGIHPYVVGDRFNREDDLTGLGVATSGQAWTADVGTLVVRDGKAWGSGSGNHRATIDVGATDYEISGTFTATAGTGQMFMMARYASGSSFIRIGMQGTTLSLQKVNPTLTGIIPGIAIATGATVRVTLRCRGEQLTVLVDGVERATATEPLNATTGTTIGIQSSTDNNPLDDLTVKLLP